MNELKLEFQLETTEIPAELDKVLVSFLKAAVENYSPALFEKLYNKNSSIGELIEFYNAFVLMKYKTYPMHQNSMRLISVKIRDIPEIQDTELIIKMKSALIVRKHDSTDNSDKYYTCEDLEFGEMVKENLSIFLEKLNLEMDISDFSITPLKGKKVVTRTWGRLVDGSIGIYKITGNLELLNFLRAAGLGTRRSIGKGMWEVIY